MDELQVVALLFVLIGAAVGGAAVMTWFERRMLGIWQDRLGPNRLGPLGIFLVAADMIKLLGKHDWVPPFSDRPVFVFAPTAIVISMMLGFAVVPFAPNLYVIDMNIGLLFFLGMTSLAVYSVLLGGLAWCKYVGRTARARVGETSSNSGEVDISPGLSGRQIVGMGPTTR